MAVLSLKNVDNRAKRRSARTYEFRNVNEDVVVVSTMLYLVELVAALQ